MDREQFEIVENRTTSMRLKDYLPISISTFLCHKQFVLLRSVSIPISHLNRTIKGNIKFSNSVKGFGAIYIFLISL